MSPIPPVPEHLRFPSVPEHLRSRPGDQPLPVLNDCPSVQGLVRADLDAREQVGITRYGTSLQPHNGRDAMRDLYEELLDACCYARQVIEERSAESVTRQRTTCEVELERMRADNKRLRRAAESTKLDHDRLKTDNEQLAAKVSAYQRARGEALRALSGRVTR